MTTEKPWVTADGVRVGPDDRVYWVSETEGRIKDTLAQWTSRTIDVTYSTPLAAVEAARRAEINRHRREMENLDSLVSLIKA